MTYFNSQTNQNEIVNGFGTDPARTLYFPQGQDCKSLEVSNAQESGGLLRTPLCRMKCDENQGYVGRTMFYRCKRHTHAFGYPVHFGSWQWLEPVLVQRAFSLDLGGSVSTSPYSLSTYPFDMGEVGFRQSEYTVSGAGGGDFAGQVNCKKNVCDVEKIVNATDCGAGGGGAKLSGLDLTDCTERVPYGGNCTVTCGLGFAAARKRYDCASDDGGVTYDFKLSPLD